MTMSIARISTAVSLQKLSTKSRVGCRCYTQTSQTLCKIEQPVGSRTSKKSGGWVIPAALAVIGLGLSTFSTQKLVSSNHPIRVFSSTTTTKSS